MKCKFCGYESENDFNFCAKCGCDANKETATVAYNEAENKVIPALRDNLFFITCILMTISAAAAILSGGLNVISILITIFLWLTYSKSKLGVVDVNSLKFVSGTVYANYVLTNIAAILGIISGILTAFAMLVLPGSTAEIYNTLIKEIGKEIPFLIDVFSFAAFKIAGIVIALFISFVSVVALVINVLGMKKIHSFAKSVYKGVMLGDTAFYKPVVVKNWLIFFGVCSAFSALTSLSGNFFTAVSLGASAAAMFIAAVLIKRYFIIENRLYL